MLRDFVMMQSIRICLGLAVAIALTGAGHAQTKPIPENWVQVTRPMLACGAVNDSAELRALLLATYPAWKSGKPLPEGCRHLKVGEKFVLDHEQTEADRRVVTKMWARVCERGCVPAATPVYAPAQNVAGVYLRTTRRPKPQR
jgi:hypothetical protein